MQAEQQEELFLDYLCKYVCIIIIMLSFEAQVDYDQRLCREISAFIQASISFYNRDVHLSTVEQGFVESH